MNNDPESDTNKEINFFRSGVDTPSVACPGVVMGVVHFPFQPQGELYVSLLPSLQFYLQKKRSQPGGGNCSAAIKRWNTVVSCRQKCCIFKLKNRNNLLKAGNSPCRRSSDNFCATLPRSNNTD